MTEVAQTSWTDLELEWQAHNTYAYKRTNLVELLRDADRHVNQYVEKNREMVGALRSGALVEEAGHSTTPPQVSVDKRPRTTEVADGPHEAPDSHDGTTLHQGNNVDECAEVDRLCQLRNDATVEALYAHLVKIQAPMVRFSRPPFRKLCRVWGTDINYTHMILADSFANAAAARHSDFALYEGEERLVVQMAAKSGPTAAQAARLMAPYCDAFDLNCGCPQRWAIKEGIGSALLDDPALVADMVKCIRNAMEGFSCEVAPPTCVVKIRVKDDIRQSVDFARQIAAAGAGWVTVHGRTPTDAPAARVRCEMIRLLHEDLGNMGVPVVANGAVTDPSSALHTAVLSGVGGVMAANGLLDNPAMFYLPETGADILHHFSFAPERIGCVNERCTEDGSFHLYDRLHSAPHQCHMQRSMLQSVCPFPLDAASRDFRPLWSLPPVTPREVVSDFLRAALGMDMPCTTTVQQVVRLARGFLSPTERVQLSYLKSNVAVLNFFSELGLYTAAGRLPLS